MFIPLYWCITYSSHFIYPFHHNLLLRWNHLPSLYLQSGQLSVSETNQTALCLSICQRRYWMSSEIKTLILPSNKIKWESCSPFLCAWNAIIFALNEVCYQIVEPNATISVSNTLGCANAVSGYSHTYVEKFQGWGETQISLSSP